MEEFFQLLNSFRKKVKVEITDQNKLADTKVWNIMYKGNKPVQVLLTKSDIVPTAVMKWNTKLETELDWRKLFQKSILITKDMRSRWFQLRLLHRIVPKNKILYNPEVLD